MKGERIVGHLLQVFLTLSFNELAKSSFVRSLRVLCLEVGLKPRLSGHPLIITSIQIMADIAFEEP
jgi:hypothetical protein